MKTLSRQITMLIIAYFVASALSAQVTIGTGEKPSKGALLDLKEHAPGTDKTTATKGMLLPRVNLTNLKPTAVTGTDGLPASIGSPATENWNLEDHIGLVVFNVNQCIAGDQIPVGSYVWSGTEWQYLGKEDIAPGVEYHPDKPGVYEGFWSATFGDAGEWMTTNLTAWAYDGNAHSQGFPLTQSTSTGWAEPYWSYPNGGTGGSDVTSHTANPHLGLLYNWSAATAGKGGSNGQGNIYNTSGGIGSNNESGYPEGTGSLQQQRIQGICPTGWHLPSDYEWTELERAIINNKDKFSSAATSTGTDLTNELDGVSQPTPGSSESGNRGLTTANGHGNAMKSPCPVPSSLYGNPGGLSKTIKQNGFSALLAGFGGTGSEYVYGLYGNWWSASSGNITIAWIRGMVSFNSQVIRDMYSRIEYFSVRCKKD